MQLKKVIFTLTKGILRNFPSCLLKCLELDVRWEKMTTKNAVISLSLCKEEPSLSTSVFQLFLMTLFSVEVLLAIITTRTRCHMKIFYNYYLRLYVTVMVSNTLASEECLIMKIKLLFHRFFCRY